jgi:hypothetical protein
MMWISSMQGHLLRRLSLAGLLVVGLGVSRPLGAQGPPVLPQPAQQEHARSAKAQAAGRTGDQSDVRQPRTQLADQRHAALKARTERQRGRTRLFELKKATLRAEADYQNARLARALAELAIEEYEQSRLEQDLATADGEILLAESDLSRAEDRTLWARRMFDKGYVSKAQKVAEEAGLKKTQFALEQAQAKRTVLVDYVKGKTKRELRSALDKACAEELEKQQLWLQAKTSETDFQRKLGSN